MFSAQKGENKLVIFCKYQKSELFKITKSDFHDAFTVLK